MSFSAPTRGCPKLQPQSKHCSSAAGAYRQELTPSTGMHTLPKSHLHLSSQQGHPAMQRPTWAATDTLPRRGNKRVTAPHVASPRVTRTQMAMVYMEHEELYSLIKDGKDAQVFIRLKKMLMCNSTRCSTTR